MRLALFGLTAVAVVFAFMNATSVEAGEPLMQQGSASVTPGDDTPPLAVDSLSDDVSPTASANTTATDQVDDDVAPAPANDEALPADPIADRASNPVMPAR